VERNHLLAFTLSIGVIMVWMLWQGETRRPPVPAPSETPQAEAPDSSAPLPEAKLAPLPSLADEGVTTPEASEPVEAREQIDIEMPRYSAALTSRGAGISKWSLKTYEEGPRNARVPVVLTTGQAPFATVMTTSFSELGQGNLAQVEWDVVERDDSNATFRVTRKGVSVTKAYRFHPDSYAFDLEVRVENGSDGVVAPRFAVDWPAAVREGPDFREQGLVALHQGSLESEFLSGGPMSCSGAGGTTVEDYPREVDFAGVQTTYFLSALLPDEPIEASARFEILTGTAGVTRVYFDPVSLEPGQSATRTFRGYMGPKEVEELEALGGSAVESIDVGWSWIAPMTRFFAWMLRALYSIVPNYGVAIVILTILVRVVTLPLVTKQMRSMEGMRELQPKIKELQAKFKDDKQKQSEAMMSLYRSEGVNPLGGCLPMILQLPVMIGLFYALRSSIELREAPFFGWISDLSAPETLFMIPGLDLPVRVLPLIMGATMVLQQRMTPQPAMDPAQARMMTTVMPIVMTVVFYQFASGLVLYWMLSNVLAIAHQLWIRRGNEARAASGAGKSGGSKSVKEKAAAAAAAAERAKTN
jgi:YidC/Oxa1 family membrane protein insertase